MIHVICNSTQTNLIGLFSSQPIIDKIARDTGNYGRCNFLPQHLLKPFDVESADVYVNIHLTRKCFGASLEKQDLETVIQDRSCLIE